MSEKSTIKNELRWIVVCIGLGVIGLGAYAASKFTPGKLVVLITGLGLLGFLAMLVVLAFRLKNLKQILAVSGIALVSVVVGTYLLLFAFVLLFQDTVVNRTSSFFQPKTITVETAQSLVTTNVTALDLAAPDGVHLRGWMVRNSTEEQTPLIIYFGGSGSESSGMLASAKGLTGWSVALVNYRGFGLSEGKPTQASVLADSLLIYDALTKRADIDPERVVVMGYSLGTGPAVYLSDRRAVAGTILASPYDHWSLIGVKQSPLFAPLTAIMKPYFDSISYAPDIETPALFLVGADDTSVPPELSRRLADAWGGQVNVIEYAGEDHGLLYHNNSSWTDIEDFLAGLMND